jgi:exoribonuclease-2
MEIIVPGKSSLVLYKRRPARVLSVADKLEIELEDGKTQRVRPKDVVLLHPGPLDSLAELTVQAGEVEDAWEILAGGRTELPELAELVFGAHTPSTSWATWQLVDQGIYFHGTPEAIQVRGVQELEEVRRARQATVAEAENWSAFLKRLQNGKPLAEDDKRLNEVEAMALGRSNGSRILRELGRQETPEAAHALLLRLGRWGDGDNPHPRRLKLPSTPTLLNLPPLPDEERRDLTHLEAFAIDDAGNLDPDDAVSLDGHRIWVHVADVAALVRPDGPADVEARERGVSLYLPETTVPMLPPAATHMLGLGLEHLSPALSFGLTLDANAEVVGCEVVPSVIRGIRLSYEEAEGRLAETPFAKLMALAECHRRRRLASGAATIDLPEVKVRVEDGEVRLTPLPRLRSRQMVTEAMLMAGQGAARFALDREIPIPFTTQAPPDTPHTAEGMAAMFACRKKFQRSQMKTAPAPHAGLGLEVYAQATSPLRRYLDLVVHQQLRALLRGERLLTAEQVLDRIGRTEAAVGSMRQGERLSNRHWTLVYLRQHPDWEGNAVVVEKRGRRGIVIIPALGLDASMQLPGDPPLDTVVRVRCTGVDLPGLTAHFRTQS